MTNSASTAIVDRLRKRQKQYAAVRTTQDIADDFGDAADEIEALRAVISSLHHAGRIVPGPMPFMRHSPADEAYDRALGRDSGSTPSR